MFDDLDLSEIEYEKDELLSVVYDDSDEQIDVKPIEIFKPVYKKNKFIKPYFPYRKEKIIIPSFQYRPGDPTAKNVYTEHGNCGVRILFLGGSQVNAVLYHLEILNNFLNKKFHVFILHAALQTV